MTVRGGQPGPPDDAEPDIWDGDEPNGGNALAGPLPRRRVKLDSLMRVRLEMSEVYRQARDGKRPVGDAARLVYVLHTIARLIEGSSLELRVEALERAAGGDEP